jgi:hypothetical protein
LLRECLDGSGRRRDHRELHESGTPRGVQGVEYQQRAVGSQPAESPRTPPHVRPAAAVVDALVPV